jgi:hypothetical protein
MLVQHGSFRLIAGIIHNLADTRNESSLLV